MALVDAQRRHVEVNGAYVTLLGYKPEALHRPAGAPRGSSTARSTPPPSGRGRSPSADSTARPWLERADGGMITVAWGATRRGRHRSPAGALRGGGDLAPEPVSLVRPSPPRGADVWVLSKRQREVVRLVALGHTGPEIADELQISHDTVRTHVRNAMAASGTRSRAHLVAKALGDGMALA